VNPALRPLMQPRDTLHPPSADNPRVGALLSALAHAGLITALALGVQWHTETPDGVEAELWASVPQIAAPRPTAEETAPEPVAPPPPVAVVAPPPPRPTAEERDADIATERAERERLAKERREAEDQRARERRERDDLKRQEQLDKRRQEQQQAELRQQQQAKQQREQAKQEQQRKDQIADAAREKARQDQLRRMNEQLNGTGAANSTGNAARDAGPSAEYAGRIRARIKANIVLLSQIAGNPQAEIELRVAPDGSILSRRLTKPSGNKDWDETMLRAIDKTAVLPRDTDGRVPGTMLITFRPLD
jgi:colicin import membrane protein